MRKCKKGVSPSAATWEPSQSFVQKHSAQWANYWQAHILSKEILGGLKAHLGSTSTTDPAPPPKVGNPDPERHDSIPGVPFDLPTPKTTQPPRQRHRHQRGEENLPNKRPRHQEGVNPTPFRKSRGKAQYPPTTVRGNPNRTPRRVRGSQPPTCLPRCSCPMDCCYSPTSAKPESAKTSHR